MSCRKNTATWLRCLGIALLGISTMGASKCQQLAAAQAARKAQKKLVGPVAGVHPGLIGAEGTGQMLARHGPEMVGHWQRTGRFDPDDINTYPGRSDTPADPYDDIKNEGDRSRLNDLDRRIADPKNADVRDNLIRQRERILSDYPSFNPGRSTAQDSARTTAQRTATGTRPPMGGHSHTPPPVHTHAHH